MSAAGRKIALRFSGVSHRFPVCGEALEKAPFVLREIDLELAESEIVCIVGKSGCGKTTLLNLAAGLFAPCSGRVLAADGPVTGPGAERAMMFQRDTLFPWLSVRGNIEFGQRCSRKRGASADVERMIDLVGLNGFEDYRPAQLSGGMRQRVALARALINQSPVLLLDEPFAALDALTRETMQELVLDVHARFRPSLLMVTHEINEAVFMADRIIVMAGSGDGSRIVSSLATELPRPRLPELREHPRMAHLRNELRRQLCQ